MKTRFEWDPAKAASNLRKHGVSFETAARVFADLYALVERDRIESAEERWQTIGIVEGHDAPGRSHYERTGRYRSDSDHLGKTGQPPGKETL